MNAISLCCTSHRPNLKLLDKMIASADGFDQKILHINSIEPNIPCYITTKCYLNEPPMTAAQGFNFVISKAKTEWVVPFCDDDFFHKENLKELLTWFHNTNIQEDIIQFPCYVGNDIIDWRIWGDKLATYEGLRKQNMIPFSCFYRKLLWEKVGGYDNLLFNDWGFWLKALKLGATIKYWNKPIYYFRQGIEERLSDKEKKIELIENIREKLLKRVNEL